MQNLETLNQARRIAEELLKQAEENELQITADLEIVAKEVSAEIVGLEHKFKSKISLIRKLIETVEGDFQKLQRKSKIVNDVLRYTFILPLDIYADGFQQANKILREFGYKIPENRIWNAWDNIGTQYDKGYRGINITIISSQRQKFELQFHTAESFRLKTETHYLYKEMRDKKISDKRLSEITDKMLKMAAKVEIPDGI